MILRIERELEQRYVKLWWRRMGVRSQKIFAVSSGFILDGNKS